MRYSEFKARCRSGRIKPVVNEDQLMIYSGKIDDFDTVHKKVRNPSDRIDDEGIHHLVPIGYCRHSYYIACPYCGEVHIHGRIGGYRVPHCSRSHGLSNYYIEEVTSNA